jgi:hypothetical protein
VSSDELSRWLNSTSRAVLDDLMAEDPDAVRLKAGPRAALRKLEVQAARISVHALPTVLIDPPSRRSRRPVKLAVGDAPPGRTIG